MSITSIHLTRLDSAHLNQRAMRVMTVTWVVKALVEATACSLPAFRYTPGREGDRGKERDKERESKRERKRE